MKAKPDKYLANSDPGDETLRRYDYQKSYTTIVALEILKADPQIVEVFCEQFEDVLVKTNDGKFIGIQVKTQDLSLGPFSSSDEKIIKCLRRFVDLERTFPECFVRYTIATNTGFLNTPFNHKNIEYLIQLAKQNKIKELVKDRSLGKRIIKRIGEACKCDEAIVIQVLTKLNVHPKFASLEKAHLHVIDGLRQINIVKDQTYGILESIANRLYELVSKASSLDQCGNDVGVYLHSNSPSDEKIKAIIDGKRISKDKLQRVIQAEIDNPVSLFLKDKLSITDIPRTEGKMVIKMDAGNINSDNVTLTKDHKYSAEAHLISWLHRQNPNTADKKYNQVRLAVKTECQEAYDDEKTDNLNFGEAMLKNLRNRLRHRYREEPETFFGCKYEHLLGMAGILTEDCEVWWSEKFNIK